LYTFPQNQKLSNGRKGWYASNQRGRGAVALGFNKDAVNLLLSSQHMVQKVQCRKRPHRNLDGAIVTAFKKYNAYEYVHNPSLVQHIGEQSSMGNSRHPHAQSFPGEDLDALSLLEQEPPVEVPPPAPAEQATPEPAPAPVVQEPKEETPSKLMIVGVSDFKGVGKLCRDVVHFMGAEKWLCSRRLCMAPLRVQMVRTTGRPSEFVRHTKDVRAVLFFDHPEYERLPEATKVQKVRSVCVLTKDEPLGEEQKWRANVDLFVCPGQTSYASVIQAGLTAVLYEWPTDLSMAEGVVLRDSVMGITPFPDLSKDPS